MPRRTRNDTGGYVYHVLNRASARGRIFKKEFDYLAYEQILAEVCERMPMRVLGYCLMPTHWHLVLWPKRDGELSEFMRLVTVTHTQRWHSHYKTAGTGPLYQGRFKSFPIERDEHVLNVLRYVEGNPPRADLVEKAQAWRWSSLAKHSAAGSPEWLLDPKRWPVERRKDWISWVNRGQSVKEVEEIRLCVNRGRPYGSEGWIKKTARDLDLESTIRPRGRPRKGHETKKKDS